jgi:hypothetical protein
MMRVATAVNGFGERVEPIRLIPRRLLDTGWEQIFICLQGKICSYSAVALKPRVFQPNYTGENSWFQTERILTSFNEKQPLDFSVQSAPTIR